MITLEKFDAFQEQIKYLEKRISNMLREIELKDIQIKSQEQMINRRNKELEDYKNKNSLGDGDNLDEKLQDLISKLQALETYNENLMKDNVLLFENNKYLQKKMKEKNENQSPKSKTNYTFEDFENKEEFFDRNIK